MKTSRANTLRVSRFFLPAFFAALILAACSPAPDPRTAPIAAATAEDFAAWKIAAYEKFTPAERDEFDQCVNQLRLEIRMRDEASGEAAVAQALCDRVNGKTVREVLIRAYTFEAGSIAKELERQRATLVSVDARLDGPGSEDSKAGPRAFRVAVVDAIDKLEARQARAKARLEELKP